MDGFEQTIISGWPDSEVFFTTTPKEKTDAGSCRNECFSYRLLSHLTANSDGTSDACFFVPLA